MDKLEKILAGIDSVNEFMGKGAGYLIVLIMLFTVYDVLLRYFIKVPTLWAFETNQYLLSSATALGGGFVLLNKGHVNVEILYGRFSPRVKAILDLLTAPMIFLFLIIFLRESVVMVWDSISVAEHSESVWAPPRYPFKIVILIGVVLILLQSIAKTLRDVFTILKGPNRLEWNSQTSRK